MTKKQDCLYWREWAAAHKTCPSADRHQLHIDALGEDKSHKDFSNADLDKVLAAFRALSQPNSLDAQLHQISQPKKRLLWKITVQQAALLKAYISHPTAYLDAIIADQFPGRLLDDLDARELENLRSTLAARIGAMRNKAGHTIHQMHTLAAIQCPCSECSQSRSQNLRARATLQPF